MLDDVRDTLVNRMATHRIDLERLVAIPSVSAAGFDADPVRRCAEEVRDLLAARGCHDARLLEVDGGPPAVTAAWSGAGDDRPTVLCYAHYDVQPPGDAAAWTSPPFEPTERDGRLYGRGTADDKAGILVHVAAIDAWLSSRDHLPVNVRLLIEGEEEVGSPHLHALLDAHAEQLRADVVVITDSTNWRIGVPGLTHSLRGLVDCVVEVRALDHPLHSGLYGGPVPDPMSGLMKLLASATDDHGIVTIPGFDADLPAGAADTIAGLDFDEQRFRREAGMLDGVALVGDPDDHVLTRLWYRPTLTVLGVDAPAVDTASNTLAAAARAKVSVRLAPTQDPQRAQHALVDFLERNVPWGLQVTVTPGAAAAGYLTPADGAPMRAARRAMHDAWGTAPAVIGVGGGIPLVDPLTRGFGGIPALLTGVEDPDTRAHGIDESLHLDDWGRACLAQAHLLAELADAADTTDTTDTAGVAGGG